MDGSGGLQAFITSNVDPSRGLLTEQALLELLDDVWSIIDAHPRMNTMLVSPDTVDKVWRAVREWHGTRLTKNRVIRKRRGRFQVASLDAGSSREFLAWDRPRCCRSLPARFGRSIKA